MLQGVYCGEQPYKVIALCAVAIAVCCLGLLRFQVETDPQRLWVGSASLAAREKAQYEVTPALLQPADVSISSQQGSALIRPQQVKRRLMRKAVENKLTLPGADTLGYDQHDL